MSNEFIPAVGDWYKDEEGSVFKIIHVDELGGTVEVQHYDGAVESIDVDNWFEIGLIPHAAPEDWSGPFDDLTADDLDETAAAMRPHEWGNPLDTLESED